MNQSILLSDDAIRAELDRDTAPASPAPVTLERVEPEDWDAMAPRFADHNLDQAAAYARARWGTDNIECVVFRSAGRIVGGCSVIVKKVPMTGTGIAVIKWGPVWRDGETPPSTDRLAAILQCLADEFCRRRNLHLTIMPPADPDYAETFCAHLADMGFRQGRSLPSPDRFLVNTELSPDELRASLAQKFRYNLKKAQNNEFDITFAQGPEAISSFLELYRQMLERKKFFDYSAIDSLTEYMENATPAAQPKIVLASHDGKLTAGGVFWICGETALYIFGATDDRALKLKAGYAMHWWLAEHLCTQPAIRRYDLGGTELDAGLHQFKKGFVGKRGTIIAAPPAYHFAQSAWAGLVGDWVFRLNEVRRVVLHTLAKIKRATN